MAQHYNVQYNSGFNYQQKRIIVKVDDQIAVKSRQPKNGKEFRRGTKFESKNLQMLNVFGFSEEFIDLMSLVAVIEFVDRNWVQSEGTSRTFKITAPVKDPKFWKIQIAPKMSDVLEFLTGDNWKFNFTQRDENSYRLSTQAGFSFENKLLAAVPYSGGLDSMAVYNLMGGDARVLGVQITGSGQTSIKNVGTIVKIPFKVQGHKNKSSRCLTRAFKFATITAIAAKLQNIDRIVIPESGQGSFGPSLVQNLELKPDYRNYPKFFRKMELFLDTVLDYKFTFEQPQLMYTKAQTLGEYLNLPDTSKADLLNTESCWQSRRIVNANGTKKQCGICAACLLRRMSFHELDVDEDPSVYIASNLSANDLSSLVKEIPYDKDKCLAKEYFISAVNLFEDFSIMAKRSNREIKKFAIDIAENIENSIDDTMINFRNLLISHSNEWQKFKNSLGKNSILNKLLEEN